MATDAATSNKIELEIVTPRGRALAAQVDEVTAPSVAGEFGVLLMFGYGLSSWFGVALIDASAIVNLLLASAQYHLVRALNRGQDGPQYSTILALPFALFIASLGSQCSCISIPQVVRHI